MSRTATRTLAALLPAVALALTPLSAVSAAPAPRPDTIPLAQGSLPEGISAGPGSTFFAGARRDGAVYVGHTTTGAVRQLVAGRQGETAVGLLHDAATGRLWVAGGSTGDITAYDASTGAVLYTVNTGAGRFLNDVAVTDDAVYVTDSTKPEVIVLDTPGGALPTTPRVVTLTGDYRQPAGFGLNGIRALPTGELLVVSGGVLYAFAPTTGAVAPADRIELSGRQLTAGDGLVLDGRTLYVVNGYGGDEVAVVRLAADGDSARATGLLRDSDLDRPTTGAVIGDSLYVVNGRFGAITNDPAADGRLDVDVVRLRTR
ncbi:MAG: hypothetical protein JWN08_1976 [Frankiales bacterium]|nr:hypothetical protein [Frankiales bacterium]